MKKIIYSIVPVLIFLTILSSCESDGDVGFKQSEDGVNFRLVADQPQINLLATDVKVNLTAYSENENIDNVSMLIELAQNGTLTTRRVLKTLSGSEITNDGSTKLSFTLDELAEAVGTTADVLGGGDAFTIYNIVTLDNGLVFPDTLTLTDATGTKQVLNVGNVFTVGGTTSYTLLLTLTLVCPSNLGGEFSYVTSNIECDNCAGVPGAAACGASVSGTGELVATGGGVYTLTDATFGQYDCAWADAPASGVTFLDVCDHVYFGGADQYGLIYSFTIVSNTGTTLTINWQNDYGDSGTSALTRTDGKTWPATIHD